MKLFRTSNAICLALVISCVAPTVYRSSGPETRGERAIASDIELAREFSIRGGLSLGALYAKERSHTGVAQNLLFALRPTLAAASVTSYNLRRTTSISLEQGQRLLLAIDKFIATDPASLGPTKLFNFELSAGPIDESVGPPDHHPFLHVTFSVICSVTASGKYFALTVPAPNHEGAFETLEFDGDSIQALRQAIDSAIKMGE